MRRSQLRQATVTGLGALAVVATMTMTASPASADTPFSNALCNAAENIQFYTSTSTSSSQSYKVYAGEYIRVVYVQDSRWAYGHGEGHSDRWFVWQHSNGADRLYNCHYT